MFVATDFVVPAEHRARNFILRPLRASHLEIDFEALRIAGARLRSVFAANDSWPRDGITLDEDLEDLRRHEAEWERRLAFAYTVLSADESRCLGCVYLNPATKLGHDCECLLWTTDAAQDGALEAVVRDWLATAWPFRAVGFPGRPPTPWSVWEKLPWRDEAVPRIGADAATVLMYNPRACGLALADQSIEVTSGRLAQLAQQTVVQLFTGEAEAVRRDIGVGWRALQGEGVRAGAYVSPGLLLGAPVALLRYLAGSPIFAGALLALIAFTLGLEEISDPAAPAVEYVADLAFSGLETVVLLRVMLVGLIEERNFALARNIRAASMQVLTPPEAARERGAGKDGAAVVAVLGMAHLNGVRKLLTTSRAV